MGKYNKIQNDCVYLFECIKKLDMRKIFFHLLYFSEKFMMRSYAKNKKSP